jgi:hypothetical protein
MVIDMGDQREAGRDQRSKTRSLEVREVLLMSLTRRNPLMLIDCWICPRKKESIPVRSNILFIYIRC